MKDWSEPDSPLAVQEAALSELLHELAFGSVLDAGCGTGRLAGLVLANWPSLHYVGIDASAPRLALARRRFPGRQFLERSIVDHDGQADLVLCVQVLMHLPPPELVEMIERLKTLTVAHLVTIDHWGADAAHDYRPHLGEPVVQIDRQAIFHWTP